ncbi:hypothetical protein [Halobaculum limi]|uniref:hypothetical protein n=1 Tax=Halobaculum limi TaxID=3031916 RepID=UPI002406B71C|nr:hypothetical protein [Halobaculum sp. YSMS11]
MIGFDLPVGRSDGADDGRADKERTEDTGGDEDGRFDPSDAFVPERLPEPTSWLTEGEATVLTGESHVETRAMARAAFEERGVRDATFGYVLTKLDRDRNHPDAGFRFARDGDTLRVVFTATTAFCPQGGALALATFRALNAEGDRHEYDVVRVRVDETYHASEGVNDRLTDAEREFRETGRLPGGDGDGERVERDDARPQDASAVDDGHGGRWP